MKGGFIGRKVQLVSLHVWERSIRTLIWLGVENPTDFGADVPRRIATGPMDTGDSSNVNGNSYSRPLGGDRLRGCFGDTGLTRDFCGSHCVFPFEVVREKTCNLPK